MRPSVSLAPDFFPSVNPNHGHCRRGDWRFLLLRRAGRATTSVPSGITMRDRSKNRRPTQRGRYLSVEAIQAVQSLKRASKPSAADTDSLAVQTKLRRLVKTDLIAVLKELLNQREPRLALQVFDEIRKEHWYRPQLFLYVDMISVMGTLGLRNDVEYVCSCLKKEALPIDIEGFNLLLKTLLEFEFTQLAMDCFRLMKLWDNQPDESTYCVLIHGLESNGEAQFAGKVREEAEDYIGRPLDESEVVFVHARTIRR